MSTGYKPTAVVVDASLASSAAREPQLFRFGLKQLFFLVSATSLLSALAATMQGPWPWIIGLLASLVAAHIAGNFLGTRLRDTSADVRRWRSTRTAGGPDEPVVTPQPVRWAELSLPGPTPLALQEPAPLPGRRLVAVGSLVSAAAGGTALALQTSEQTGWSAIAVGSLSCGVIGAWVILAASSFWAISRQAWRHAQGKSCAVGEPTQAGGNRRQS